MIYPKFLPVKPEFNLSAIISVALVFLVSATETIGDTTACCVMGVGRDPSEKEISGSLACDGYCSSLAGLFSCMPITSFSQNVGLIAMTKVVNRFTIATGGNCINSCRIIFHLLEPSSIHYQKQFLVDVQY